MERRVPAFMAALASFCCLVSGELDWFVLESEFSKIQNPPAPSDGERERGGECVSCECVSSEVCETFSASAVHRNHCVWVCVLCVLCVVCERE